jgi:hypothetical protein
MMTRTTSPQVVTKYLTHTVCHCWVPGIRWWDLVQSREVKWFAQQLTSMRESRDKKITQNSSCIKQRVVRLKTVNLTRFWYFYRYENLGRMPVLRKYTGCLVQVWVQQENKYSNTGTMCWYEPNRKTRTQQTTNNTRKTKGWLNITQHYV